MKCYGKPNVRELRRDWLQTWYNYNKQYDGTNYAAVTGRGPEFGLEPKKFVSRTMYSSPSSFSKRLDLNSSDIGDIHKDGTPYEPDFLSYKKTSSPANSNFSKYAERYLPHPDCNYDVISKNNTHTESNGQRTQNRPRSRLTNNVYKCKICGISSTIVRYMCVQCPDFSICPHCEIANIHSMHYMIRLPASGGSTVTEAMSVIAGARHSLYLCRMNEKKAKVSTSATLTTPTPSPSSIRRHMLKERTPQYSQYMSHSAKDTNNHVRRPRTSPRSKTSSTYNETRTAKEEFVVKESTTSFDSHKLYSEMKGRIKVPRLKLNRKNSSVSCKSKIYNATLERKRTVVEKVVRVSSDKLDNYLKFYDESSKNNCASTTLSSDQKYEKPASDSTPYQTSETPITPVIRVNTMICEVKNFRELQPCKKCKKKQSEKGEKKVNKTKTSFPSPRVWTSKYDITKEQNVNTKDKTKPSNPHTNRILICAKYKEKPPGTPNNSVSSRCNKYDDVKKRILVINSARPRYDKNVTRPSDKNSKIQSARTMRESTTPSMKGKKQNHC